MRALSVVQADDVRAALRHAEQRTGLRFALFVGPAPSPRRQYAERLHAALGDEAPQALLILVDPEGRGLEIVTGERVRLLLPDARCRLVAMSMVTAFSGGDLAGGILYGVNALAQQALRRG